MFVITNIGKTLVGAALLGIFAVALVRVQDTQHPESLLGYVPTPPPSLCPDCGENPVIDRNNDSIPDNPACDVVDRDGDGERSCTDLPCPYGGVFGSSPVGSWCAPGPDHPCLYGVADNGTCLVPVIEYCGDFSLQSGEECDQGEHEANGGRCCSDILGDPATCIDVSCGETLLECLPHNTPTTYYWCVQEPINGCSHDCTCAPGYDPDSFGGCIERCGNGIINFPEDCDPGDFEAAPGCDSECKCESGLNVLTNKCHYDYCGDSFIEASRNEECDPPDGGSCNAACRCAVGYVLQDGVCVTTCGNDRVDYPPEECDGDANCAADCRCEVGFVRNTDPASFDACVPSCPNGVWNSADGEQCDGSSNCTTICTCDTGYEPNNPANGLCRNKCGNGVLDDPEQCDPAAPANHSNCFNYCSCHPGYKPTPSGGCTQKCNPADKPWCLLSKPVCCSTGMWACGTCPLVISTCESEGRTCAAETPTNLQTRGHFVKNWSGSALPRPPTRQTSVPKRGANGSKNSILRTC